MCAYNQRIVRAGWLCLLFIGCGQREQEAAPTPAPTPTPAVAQTPAAPGKPPPAKTKDLRAAATDDKNKGTKAPDPIEKLLRELALAREPGVLLTLRALAKPELNPAWANAHKDPTQRARISKAMMKLMVTHASGQGQAAAALHVWVVPEQVPDLIDFVQKTGEYEQNIIRALGKIKDPRCVAAIARLYKKHRREASQAFQDLGGELSEKAVLAYFHDEQQGARDEARRLVGNFGTKLDLVIDQTLLDLKAEQAKRRYWACDWLLKFDRKQPRRAEIAKALQPLITDKEGQVNRKAIPALLRLADGENIPCLVSYLLDAGNDWDRAEVVRYLGKSKDPRVATAVVRELDSRNWAAAVDAVKTLGSAAEAGGLGKLLTHTDAQVRQRVAKLLEVVGTQASVPALREASRDQHASVASAAKRALQKIAERAQ